MRDVYIIGVGQTPVTRRQNPLLRTLASSAVQAALSDAGIGPDGVTGVYVGNMVSGATCGQQLLGALVAEYAGMRGVDAVTVESGCSSGASAARVGYGAVAGGLHDIAVVAGVEVLSRASLETTTSALAQAADSEVDGKRYASFIEMNAAVMASYMEKYKLSKSDFSHFSVNAHANALNNEHAVLRKEITALDYAASKILVDPIQLLDAPMNCDGAAALVLASEDVARALGRASVKVAASVSVSDAVSLSRRRESAELWAVGESVRRAFEMAGVTKEDIDLFELHDAYTSINALCLEAAGFAEPGQGVHFGKNGEIRPDGALPISTMGGLKARGHPVGATGVYQLVESTLQLRGEAGANQVPGASVALIQSLGAIGTTVVTHVLVDAS